VARETKIGLLLGLGVVFLFMCILQWRFGGRAHAELGDANTGSAVATTKVAQANTGALSAADLACSSNSAQGAVAAEQPLSIADLHNGLRGRDDEHGLMTTSSADSIAITAPVVPEQTDAVDKPGQAPRGAATLPEIGSPATTLEPGTAAYTVRQGDSFMKIAKAVLGQGTKWKEIAKLNPGVDSAHLKTGMKIVVPAKTAETVQIPVRDSGTTPVRETTAGQRSYTVAAGDSLGTISTKMYGTCKKVALIASANKGLNPKSLKVGTKLVIPADPSAGSSVPTVAPSSAPALLDSDTMAAGAPKARGMVPLVDPSAYPERIEVRGSAKASAVASGPSEVTTPGPAARVLSRRAPSSAAADMLPMDVIR
jgi:LysM repeat protein